MQALPTRAMPVGLRGRGYLVALCAALAAAACSDDNSNHFAATVVDIGGGRNMYIECAGVGAPTVVLIAGKGNRADTWRANPADLRQPEPTVFGQVARFTRVCAYDRPLTIGRNGEASRSDDVPAPVSAKQGVVDLHGLLTAAQVQGPAVVVGHSYGGLIARLYASTYPGAVAGLVLEDALSEGLYNGLTAAQREVLEAINVDREDVDTVGSFAQVLAAPPVRPVPMVILTADLPPISAEDVRSGAFPPAVTIEFVDALWTAQVAAQDRLARLFPGATHITNPNSRHYIHLERPQVVVDAIRDVVDAVRNAGR